MWELSSKAECRCDQYPDMSILVLWIESRPLVKLTVCVDRFDSCLIGRALWTTPSLLVARTTTIPADVREHKLKCWLKCQQYVLHGDDLANVDEIVRVVICVDPLIVSVLQRESMRHLPVRLYLLSIILDFS